MIHLNFVIKQYIDKLTLEDIIAEILLKTVKQHWQDFYKGDPTKIIHNLKDQLDTSTYNKLLKVYLEYKNKGIVH